MPARPPELVGVGVLAVALLVVILWAAVLRERGDDLRVFSAPFFGLWRYRLRVGFAAPIALGALVIAYGRAVAERLGWRTALLASWAATAVWSISLSAATGWSGLTRSLRSPYDYAPVLPVLHRLGAGSFIRNYVADLGRYPTHVKSHPPGMVLTLRILELVGLRGTGWAATALIALAASTTAAVALVVARLADRTCARGLLPFLVCSPWTLLVATSADGLYAATVAWSVALLAVAATTAPSPRASAVAVGAGLLVGCSLYFSYGLVPLAAALVLAVLTRTARWRLAVPVITGVIAVASAWSLAGFDWLAGLSAARGFYAEGVARSRPYSYFLVANLVVFGVMVGPATVAALSRRLEPRVAGLVAAAIAAVAIADVSGLSKGEVERIWLPFVPFVMVALVGLGRRPGARSWIAAQAATAVALQLLIVWPW